VDLLLNNKWTLSPEERQQRIDDEEQQHLALSALRNQNESPDFPQKKTENNCVNKFWQDLPAELTLYQERIHQQQHGMSQEIN